MSLDTLNGIEYLGAHLKFKVMGYREKTDGNIYYKIVLQYILYEPYQKEDFDYTYENCLNLQSTLQQQCPNLPILSGVGLFGFKPSAQEMEKRRLDLEKWLGALVWRCDVLGCKDFQNFSNLRKMIDPKWLTTPRPSLKLQNGHLFPVVDFYYEPDTQVCFVLTADDSIASKMQGFMGIFGKTKMVPHAQLLCYRLDVEDSGEPITKLLWDLQYQQKGILITWNEKLTILGIGFDDGNIICLRVATQKGYAEYTEFCEIKKHTSSVNGIAFNSLTGHVYSIGRDKCLITTDLANPSSILKEREFVNELTCLITNEYRLIIGDSMGNIYIFNFEDGPLQASHQIKQDVKMHITSLSYCESKHFLICSSKEGYFSVYEMGRPGKEKNTNLISLQKTLPNQSLDFSLSAKEIYINYNSNVVILESINLKNLYSLEAHEYGVTKLKLFDDIGLLITSGKDNCVKFWQFKYFPHLTMNEQIQPFRKEPVVEHKQQIRQQTIEMKEKQSLPPELDDLDHWQ